MGRITVSEAVAVMRIRSPGYPSINLQQAIGMVDKLFQVSRQNTIHREAAAKDIGYSRITGQSAKMLADLAHYGLIEKSGKGGIRVTDLAVKILHPRSPSERSDALFASAYEPSLFAEIRKQWPDGFVSENSLRGYLMREGFASAAVAPALTSFFETYRYLQQEGVTESHGQAEPQEQKSMDTAGHSLVVRPIIEGRVIPATSLNDVPRAAETINESQSEGLKLMSGERVVFVEESGPSQYLKVVASGDFDETMLEALEDYIKRQKKRLKIAAEKDD